MKIHFEWTIQAMELLEKLREPFDKTTQAWARFSSANGDHCYFSDVTDKVSLLALQSLKRSFQRLEDLQQDLTALGRSCEKCHTIVSSVHFSKVSHLTRSPVNSLLAARQ